MRVLQRPADFAAWREEARALLTAGVDPAQVQWEGTDLFLFGAAPLSAEGAAKVATNVAAPRAPKAFVESASLAFQHREPASLSLLYRLLWRLNVENPRLMEMGFDADVRDLADRAKSVSRDLHKMHAFVRFKESGTPELPLLSAWYEPDNLILREAAPFFVRRFGSRALFIATPDGAMRWDTKDLTFEWRAFTREEVAREDSLDDLWRSYYRSIFNPARVNERCMTKEMPRRFWKNLPEADLLPELFSSAEERVQTMLGRRASGVAAAELPAARDLVSLAAAARNCTACGLCEVGMQTVFGRGPGDARLMVVGEQPGDEEDRRGDPFVGPAGKLLRKLMAQESLPAESLYFTNAVKHFNHTLVDSARGKMRLHQKPKLSHVRACRPWLEAEVKAIQPTLILCLGATAAQSVLGYAIKIGEALGRPHQSTWGVPVIVSYHPSALLRAPTPEQGSQMEAQLRKDLRWARERLPALTDVALSSGAGSASAIAAGAPTDPVQSDLYSATESA